MSLCRSEYSTKLNQARLKSLQARNDAVQTVYANAREHLKSVGVSGPAYKKLLVELLAQVSHYQTILYELFPHICE